MTYAKACAITNEVCYLQPNGDLEVSCLECPALMQSKFYSLLQILRDEFDQELEEKLSAKLEEHIKNRIEELEFEVIKTSQGKPFLIRCYKVVVEDVKEGNLFL